ncbi:MAG TPA: hypothetical protein PLF16_00990 [Candidatus Staskawiczbacteria bacterium]|nr:hypothetical protein [Candidatus Staskawiczbacteria bacterium]
MNKKTIALIVVVAVLVLVAIGALVFVLMNKQASGPRNGPVVGENGEPVVVPLEEAEAQVNKDFPDTLVGTLSLSSEKATLRTDSGTYTFTPDQPVGIYQSFGVENGDRVSVKCKILDNNTIQFFSMEVAK